MTALSPIYKYGVDYDPTTTNFTFNRSGGYDGMNPAIMASPIAAQVGSYLTQLNTYEQAFGNMDMMMLMTKKRPYRWKCCLRSLFGGDSSIIELSHGWDMTYSIYAGYNGSHQTYDGVGIYQNGGRNGIALQFGARWALGKAPAKNPKGEQMKKSSGVPELQSAKFNLSSLSK